MVFDRDGYCGLKCSLPKDYNDPFELFLSMDLNIRPELLAYYNDVIQEIPQLPTTCFSRSPIVSPMWAHYANNHEGFVLEFDTKAIEEYFEDIRLEDIEYRDSPREGLSDMLAYAEATRKPRHTTFLLKYVFTASYFTKYNEWSYERECRLIVDEKMVENVSGHDILYVPSHLITSIIIGPKFSNEKIETSKTKSKKYELSWYQLQIGKSHPQPFLINETGEVFIIHNDQIVLHKTLCKNCKEPVFESKQCPWCSITKAHKDYAARGNPYRILDKYGMLNDYLDEFDKIGK